MMANNHMRRAAPKPLTAAQARALCLLTPTWKATPPKVQPSTLAVLCAQGFALSRGAYPRCKWRLSAAGTREKANRTGATRRAAR